MQFIALLLEKTLITSDAAFPKSYSKNIFEEV